MSYPRYSSFLIIVIILAIGLIFLNQWISGQVNQSDLLKGNKVASRSVKPVTSKKVEVSPKRYLSVKRTAILDPNRKFSNNIIYGDNEKIAQFKSQNGRIFDLAGLIPDGKIAFVDETRQTYGTEHYQNNLLHGSFKEYYEGGTLRREAKYAKGNLKINKEYYNDGILRMEEDNSDKLRFSEHKETGVGKVFYRDGKLMYEWNITNKGQGGFNRSYDRNGRMVAENLFDENGQLIKKMTAVEYQKK